MNAIISLVKKAAMIAISLAVAVGLSGCAPILGLAAIGAGASLVAIDHSTHAAPNNSTASVQSAQSH
jgi:uncharacterized protein YceK